MNETLSHGRNIWVDIELLFIINSNTEMRRCHCCPQNAINLFHTQQSYSQWADTKEIASNQNLIQATIRVTTGNGNKLLECQISDIILYMIQHIHLSQIALLYTLLYLYKIICMPQIEQKRGSKGCLYDSLAFSFLCFHHLTSSHMIISNDALTPAIVYVMEVNQCPG